MLQGKIQKNCRKCVLRKTSYFSSMSSETCKNSEKCQETSEQFWGLKKTE